jgi:Domain of unknown function (DUF5127)/Domain of unknown function (DUF4965)/Domain of unknown function (DUF1793)/Domain of unknown function (DUF4964)
MGNVPQPMPPSDPHSSDVPLIDRRTLLRLAGVAAVATPGLTMLDGVATARGAGAATRGAAASLDARLTLGGAPVRPPSVPLAVRSPYLSTWLPATNLTATPPRFWNGAARGLAGLIRIDGRVYAWAGRPVIDGTLVPAMTQKSLEVTATRSIFTLQARGVELVAEWLSPIEPGDLRLQSAPLSLLTVSVKSTSRVRHSVQVYADITREWVSPDAGPSIEWQMAVREGARQWGVQLRDQQPLTERNQMAQWGTAVWAAPANRALSYQSGAAVDVRGRFAAARALANRFHPASLPANSQRVFAFAQDLGNVRAGSVSFALGHVRTPLVSYGPDATPLVPLWTQYWPGWERMTAEFLAGGPAARQRAVALDAQVEQAATEAAGAGYSALCALALRQCYGATELALGPQGQPWLLGKEISSDGDVNTVDIFDQAFLAWLWLDPGLIPLVMEPILDWCASPSWQDPSAWSGIPSWEESQTRYCVHDLGIYPVAAGRVPGAGEQMPIEESAGMLIMAAAYARSVGAAAAQPFLAQWSSLWTQWAEYLRTQVPTPATQLTTDDWAPVYANPTGSVNLGIKAIIGLAAAGQIAEILGDQADAATWTAAAQDNIEPWVNLSTDPSGEYLNLEQGAAGTWSTLYNAYYEQVIGVQLVPEDVAAKQASFYLTQLTTYGMPLQTDAGDTTKVAWMLYIPAWLADYPIRDALLSRDVAYVNATPSRVPYGDRYHTTTGVETPGVQAHPTVGAVFALLAAGS